MVLYFSFLKFLKTSKRWQLKIKSLKDILVKHGDMFNAAGDIDTDEQKQLNAMQVVIKRQM
jgi:hypothetical protein